MTNLSENEMYELYEVFCVFNGERKIENMLTSLEYDQKEYESLSSFMLMYCIENQCIDKFKHHLIVILDLSIEKCSNQNENEMVKFLEKTKKLIIDDNESYVYEFESWKKIISLLFNLTCTKERLINLI